VISIIGSGNVPTRALFLAFVHTDGEAADMLHVIVFGMLRRMPASHEG